MERDRLACLGRSFDYICKWKPRKRDKAAWVVRAEAAGKFVRAIERTIDKEGQRLLVPGIELEGWWTTLAVDATEVIDLYKHHGMHEQFHSEFKTHLDLERLPSGKFDTHDSLLHLAAFISNCPRLQGQLSSTCEITPIRHPA